MSNALRRETATPQEVRGRRRPSPFKLELSSFSASGAAMVRMRGSKSTDTSTKRNKGSVKKIKEAEDCPYELYNAKQGEGSWVTKEILDANDAVIVKGHFNTMEGYRATVVMLSDSFFRMQYKPEYRDIFKRLGLEEYFSLQPWGVDIRRSWELLTTIDDDGSALLTDLDGNRLNVTITEDLIQEALKLKKGEKDLDQMHNAKEREEVFANVQGQSYTFQCMVYQDVVTPLRIHMQHFKLLKPERHTKPDARLAHPYTKARTPNAGLSYNFVKYILNDIKQLKKGTNFQKNYHLAGGHMLTRIVYHALGIIDELPPVITASASSSKWPGDVGVFPGRQFGGKHKETYEESEDEEEYENDEENEDGKGQEGDNEGFGKLMSDGEKEATSSLSHAIFSKDASLNEIYKCEGGTRLERAYYMASQKRKRILEEFTKFEPAWKEKRIKHRENLQFIQIFTDVEGTAKPYSAAVLRKQLQGKVKEELCTSSQSKEQEEEHSKIKDKKQKLHLQGDKAGNKEGLKEDRSAVGKNQADIDLISDQDRKDTVELLHSFSDATSQKTPQVKACLGLTGHSGTTYAETLLETKTNLEEAFDPVTGPQNPQENMQEAKEVDAEKVNEEGKEEGTKDQQRNLPGDQIVEECDHQQIQSRQPVDNIKTIVAFPSRRNVCETNTTTSSERKIPFQEFAIGRAITCTQSCEEFAKAATDNKKGEGKTKKELKELKIKPNEERKMNEEKTQLRKDFPTLQTGEIQVEGQFIISEKGAKSGLASGNPGIQSDDKALDEGTWLKHSMSQKSGLAAHSISQVPSQEISSSMFVSPVETLQMVTINVNDSDEMLDSIVRLLQRYKTQTTDFRKHSAAQEQLVQQLSAEKLDLGAKHMRVEGSLSVAEAQLLELQAKYQHQEEQRQLDQLNFNKLVAVHHATLQRLENANKVLDQLAQYPLSYVTNEEAAESTVVRVLREQSIELANQLATERLMRNTLATAFKDKEREMQSKIDSLEKELFVEKVKLQSEQACKAFQSAKEKRKQEQVKNFPPIDLNILDSGEASTSHIELEPIYVSSEGSQKEEM